VKIVIDFDSTLTKVEGLDELARIALGPKAVETVAAIRAITDRGMAGELSMSESLKQRILLLKANKTHVLELVEFLKTQISDSFLRNRAFFKEHAHDVLIVSGGFKDFIDPVAATLGIDASQVYANTFVYDAQGNIIGVDETNFLANDAGKVRLLESLKLDPATVHCIGDGFTDSEPRTAGLVAQFYAFIENIERPSVTAIADHIITTFDEYLYMNHLDRAQSYPKSKINVLLLENVHQVAVQMFEDEQFNVTLLKGALDEAELVEKIKGVHILGIRSKTNVTKAVLENADKLWAIGAFCIGTNQIDLKACTEQGIAVFNAPYSNTRSVVELAVGEMIMLIRNIFPKSVAMHAGQWDKSANNSFEVRGKKLGMIGYGHIGTQLSVVAENLGMQVYYYDLQDRMPMGNAKKCKTMDEVLKVSDVISVHIDGRKENTNLFTAKQFAMMKDGVVFMNLARGHVVNIPDLVAALKSGKVSGAGLDVFPYEPKNNAEEFVNELRGLPNVILTPHIGGSTEEAQEAIGEYVPEKLIEYINNGSTYGSVNFPELTLPLLRDNHRILHIHKNVPGVLAKINAVFAKHQLNINGQYLKTNEKIGYVILDVAKHYDELFIEDIKAMDETLRFRMLY
jgi:D-3-phosphoglycerate dehydrogenase / 2-oxoglutarate reductase